MLSGRITKAALLATACLPAMLAVAGTAAADTASPSMADAVVKHLQDEGYNVVYNMPSGEQLSRCMVSGISGLTVAMSADGNLMAMMGPEHSGNVYVTLNCPGSNN